MEEQVFKYDVHEGVIMMSKPHKTFSEIYLKVREKEGRVYSDEEVASLPDLNTDSKHSSEWKLRKKSANRFVSYLKKKEGHKKVIEIGCGNGWFSNLIASECNAQVCGLDLNLPELEQAARVFERDNLYFIYGDIFANVPFSNDIDIIVLNGVVQYFPDLSFLFERIKKFLKKGGEIHIIDSPFYTNEKIYEQRLQSLKYYKELGYPSMSVNYFHHSFDNIKKFDILYYGHMNKLYQLINWNDNPFIWCKHHKK